MKILKVNRINDSVLVTILLDEGSNKYRFVNLTKNHICKCQFNSIEDALKDLDNYIKKGKIINYENSSYK